MRVIFGAILSMFLSCSYDKSEGGSVPEAPAKPGSPSPQIPGGPVEQQTYMVFHNLKRCWHNVPSVRWNEALADSARTHAERCTFARDPSFGLGESVGTGDTQIKAMDDWYMEFLSFPFGKPDGNAKSERFSQMVWRSTSEIGCGSAQCGAKVYYVCRYSAKGNINGEFDKNVFWLKPDFMTCSGSSL